MSVALGRLAAFVPQFLILRPVLSLGGFVINGLVGAFAGRLRRHLDQSGPLEKALRWGAATVFGGLALRLAVQVRQ